MAGAKGRELRPRPSPAGGTAILLSVVGLFLIFGGVGHAQQPAGNATIRAWLEWEQVGGARTVCIGDEVLFNARVVRSVVLSGNSVVQNVRNTEISSEVSVARVGSVSPERSAIRLNTLPPDTVQFTFSAEEAGTTAVVFRATVSRETFLGLETGGDRVTGVASIRVDDCSYKVSTVSRWYVPGPANLYAVATIAGAGLVSTGGGHYTGVASVQWSFEVGQVGECVGNLSAADTQATLTAQIARTNITIDIDYQAAQANLYQNCRGLQNLMVFPVASAPLTVSLPWSGGAQLTMPLLASPERNLGHGVIHVERMVAQ